MISAGGKRPGRAVAAARSPEKFCESQKPLLPLSSVRLRMSARRAASAELPRSFLQAQQRVFEGEALVVTGAPRQFLKSERCIEAHGARVARIDFQ